MADAFDPGVVSRIENLEGIRDLLGRLPGPDMHAAETAAAREATLTKPPGALGRLEALTEWVCAWQGKHPPAADRCQIAIFAGNHGVTAEGVSAYPAEVTAQMVDNFRAEGAAINQLSALNDCRLTIHPLAVDTPTRNFLTAPAMSEPECAGAFELGMSAVEADTDILCIGEMGIGNTTSAAAICHALFGGDAADWVGPGTGVTGASYDNKIRVVRDAVSFHGRDAPDGLEALRRLGGREIAAMAGAIVAARRARIPVLLDGYVCCAAAATLFSAQRNALDHCLLGHVSAEPGHRRLLAAIGQQPVLDLGMRLGEGTGAALALSIVRGAVACHTGMATFSQAGVSEAE